MLSKGDTLYKVVYVYDESIIGGKEEWYELHESTFHGKVVIIYDSLENHDVRE
jgi:hypothetical protein